MKFSAALDVTTVAHEADDEVTILLELQAPDAPRTDRSPAALQVVLDRSGSMSGPPLEGAKRALAETVARLQPSDVFGLVTFDDSAQVVVPAGPLTDKEGVLARIAAISPGGMTDLSSGYLRGLRQSGGALRCKAELLSASISIAMNNTAFALSVAIPFLLIHAFLQARTSEIVDGLEAAKISFLNVVQRVRNDAAPTGTR